MSWAVGKSKQFTKTPKDKPLTIVGGRWVTVAKGTLPKGRYLVSLQIRSPKALKGLGEAHIGRVGWGTATGSAIDDTGHNPIHPRTDAQSWRTPIVHQMAGGGPIVLRIWLPKGRSYQTRVVAKALRIS